MKKMKRFVKGKALGLAQRIDQKAGQAAHDNRKPPKGLISLLFHSIYKDRSETSIPLLAKNQYITVQDLQYILEWLLEAGCSFISLADIVAGNLRSDRTYVALTFDDGYFNNTRAIPVIQEFQIPMAVFLAPYFSSNQSLYWWDAISSELGFETYTSMRPEILRSRWSDIKKQLESIKTDILMPKSDLHRPLTEDEITDLSQNPLITFHNHTMHHITMTDAYSDDEILEDIRIGEEEIVRLSGTPSSAFAYPVNIHDNRVIDIMAKTSHHAAFTVSPGIQHYPFPIKSPSAFHYPRYLVFSNGDNKHLEKQLAAILSPISVREKLVSLMRKF